MQYSLNAEAAGGTSSQAAEPLSTPGCDQRVGQAAAERCCRRETLELSHLFLLKRRSKCSCWPPRQTVPDGTAYR